MKTSRGVVLLFASCLALTACLPMQAGAADASAATTEPTDAELRASYGEDIAQGVADIRAKRAAALAAPKSLAAANAYADALIARLKQNYARVKRVPWRNYLQDGADLLAAATADGAGAPEESADALAKRATFLFTLGDNAGGKQALQAAFARAQTYLTSLGMLELCVMERRFDDGKTLCPKARSLAKTDDDVYALLHACVRLNPGEPPEQTLAWASAEDRALFQRRREREAQQNLARRRAEEEADARTAAALPTSQSDDVARPERRDDPPRGPKRVSLTLRSVCAHSVKVFYGKEPKFGSGRTDTISGNSTQGVSMNEGDMLWITDDHENGISNFVASSGTREVEISSSCTSFVVR